jgi:hypothetical protein
VKIYYIALVFIIRFFNIHKNGDLIAQLIVNVRFINLKKIIMPIRMVEDEPQHNQDNSPERGRRNTAGGGGNPLMGCLPMMLGLVFKRPKLLIPLLLIGGIGYFLFSKMGSLGGGDTGGLTTGGLMDPAKYDKVEVYEPLADNSRNPLPESYSLEKYCPKRLNQGQQGSCVAWSSAYAARTIMEAKKTNQDPNSLVFSPSFLYNSIHLDDCQGAYINVAMEEMKKNGVAPFRNMPYDESDCSTKPNNSQMQSANPFKTRGYQRLTQGGDNQRPDLLAIKQNLAAGAPVVFGMMVGGSFMREMLGKDLWQPTGEDYNMYQFGGHAMCIIGYDDYKYGGAFQLMNSWGMDWGNKGLAWVRYKDFDIFTKEAYGLYPLTDAATAAKNNILSINFGLVNNTNDALIPLKKTGPISFSTSAPIAIGTKFKLLVTNTVECYTYILGEETDGSSYVLFPYTPKHSPFCGITGTRLFPKDYSMELDNKGTKDQMAIIVSKEPLDYNQLNATVNKAKGSTYADKLILALGGSSVANVAFSDANGAIGFNVDLAGKTTVGMIVSIDKK